MKVAMISWTLNTKHLNWRTSRKLTLQWIVTIASYVLCCCMAVFALVQSLTGKKTCPQVSPSKKLTSLLCMRINQKTCESTRVWNIQTLMIPWYSVTVVYIECSNTICSNGTQPCSQPFDATAIAMATITAQSHIQPVSMAVIQLRYMTRDNYDCSQLQFAKDSCMRRQYLRDVSIYHIDKAAIWLHLVYEQQSPSLVTPVCLCHTHQIGCPTC